MFAEHYTKILYPLQDKVISIFKDSPFYLTGGTALSRGYYNHRYSEDLDYFINDRSDFKILCKIQKEKLLYSFKDIYTAYEDDNFARYFIANDELKIEIINDVPSHIGKLVNHPVLGTLDSKENILANKLTALVDRAAPKDVVDIYFLLNDGLDIKKAIIDANTKAADISQSKVSKFLKEYNYALLEKEIIWVKPIPPNIIRDYFNKVAITIEQQAEQKIEQQKYDTQELKKDQGQDIERLVQNVIEEARGNGGTKQQDDDRRVREEREHHERVQEVKRDNDRGRSR